MVRVSNTALKEATLKKLQSRFADSITKIAKRESASDFLNELLGKEEQLMLAKRLAVIYMLAENVSPYRIAQVLDMSTSTVNRMWQTFDNDGYSSIASNYLQKKNHASFWEDIDVLLRLGMPPRGKGRWKWLHDLEDKHR